MVNKLDLDFKFDNTIANYKKDIQNIKSELYNARSIILNLMPLKINNILRSYYSCESSKVTTGWIIDSVDLIIQEADVIPPKNEYYSESVYCPLCRHGSAAAYANGFKYPEGLRRHLLGVGKIHQCEVFKAIESLARSHWEQKFRAADEAERAKQLEHKAQRLLNETVYRIEPNGTPMLIDTSCMQYETRTGEEMIWAENRLVELGFKIIQEDNIKSYIDEREYFLVYADPRCNGGIRFFAYKKPLTTKPRKAIKTIDEYKIYDAWKHDLKDKYKTWLKKLMND